MRQIRKKKNTPRRVIRHSRSDGGCRYSISPHPPGFTSAPWWNLVLRLTNPGGAITNVDIVAAFLSQTGVATPAGVTMRFQSARFWGAQNGVGTGVQSLNVVIFDPLALAANASGQIGTGPRVLEQITDFPNTVSRACFGYRYPKAQRETAVSVPSIGPVSFFNTSGMGSGSVLYLEIHWRINQQSAPSLFDCEEVESSDSSIEVLPQPKTRSKSSKGAFQICSPLPH